MLPQKIFAAGTEFDSDSDMDSADTAVSEVVPATSSTILFALQTFKLRTSKYCASAHSADFLRTVSAEIRE